MRRFTISTVLCSVCLTMCAAGSAHAAIVTSVEPRLVEELDTIRLTLRVTGTSSTEALDLSALERDFEVLGSNTQSQYRSVNGRVESWVEYQISLRPRRSGELVVPSIAIGNEASETVQVIVRSLDPGIKQTIERMVFFETELSANPVYVQAETILKRRLYYSSGVQIYSDLPGAPDIPNAVVIPLGDTQSHTTVIDGQRYGVIEQQFAIFPEESGSLIIPEISITSSVRLQSGGRTRRSGIRISTDEETLKVLPIPAAYPHDQPWIPASDVRINETWTPARSHLEVGDQTHRNIAVTAVGTTGSAIPPLGVTFSDEHFKWYPEAPALDDDNKGQHVVGTRIEGYRLIPVRPGPAPLAEVALTWWDTTSEQIRVARLPATTLTITGSPLARTPQPADPATEPDSPSSARDTAAGERSLTAGRTTLLALAALLLGGAIVLAGLGLRRARQRPSAGPGGDPAHRISARSAWADLKKACAGTDARAIRAALVVFIQAHNGDSPSGNALSRFVADHQGATVWRNLNEAVYGPGGGQPIDGSEVLRAARRLRRRVSARPPDPLPGLFS